MISPWLALTSFVASSFAAVVLGIGILTELDPLLKSIFVHLVVPLALIANLVLGALVGIVVAWRSGRSRTWKRRSVVGVAAGVAVFVFLTIVEFFVFAACVNGEPAPRGAIRRVQTPFSRPFCPPCSGPGRAG